MAQDNYMLQLKEAVKNLPKGWKKQITDGDTNKDIAFFRMMQKDSVSKMTPTELEMLDKLLELLKANKEFNEKKEKEIKAILK